MEIHTHSIAVHEALERLLKRPKGAFVIIEDIKTGKFVQFAGSKDESLLLDLPSQTLSPNEMNKAKVLFTELGYPGPETYDLYEYPGGPASSKQTSFIVKFGTDIEKATELVISIIYNVFGLGEDTKLKIIEE